MTTYLSQFHFEGRVISSITLTLLAHDSPRTGPNACCALAAPFRDGADLARFCSCIFRKLDLLSSAVALLVTIVESCFESLVPTTTRMLVNAAALIVFKTINDETLCIVDAARLLKVDDVAQLRACEHYVLSVLLQTSHPSGLCIAPSAYARPLLSSFEEYAAACTFVLRERAATHIASSWRRTLAVRVLLARLAERVASRTRLAAKLQAAAELAAAHAAATLSARLRLSRRAERRTHRPASNKLAARLASAAQLDAALTIQHAYRTAASANVAPSPVSTMSRLEFAMGDPFVLDAKPKVGSVARHYRYPTPLTSRLWLPRTTDAQRASSS